MNSRRLERKSKPESLLSRLMCCQPQHCRTSYAPSRNRATTDSFRIRGRVHKHTAWRARAAKARRKTTIAQSLFRNFDAGVGRRGRVLTGWSRRGLSFYSSGTRRPSRPLASTASKQNRNRRDRVCATSSFALLLFEGLRRAVLESIEEGPATRDRGLNSALWCPTGALPKGSRSDERQ